MATVEKIRNGLIDKILSIRNKDFLQALDKLISSSASESDIVELTNEQKAMLEMSEKDIKNGSLISQEEMNKRNLEWLNAVQSGQKLRIFNLQEFQSTGQKGTNRVDIQKKLVRLVTERTHQIAETPFIYKSTDFKDIRIASLGNFSIYYKATEISIIISAFWDNRQDPKKLLEILLNEK